MPHKDPAKRREYCRTYQRETWYPANRALHIQRVRSSGRKRMAAIAAEIERIKSGPCAECHRCFPPVCMDFDHLDGHVKVDHVSNMLRRRGMSAARIMAEIAKCDVVCANCHRLRTSRRRVPGKADTAA